ALAGIEHLYNLHWVGWPGGIVHDAARQKELKETLFNDYKYLPVFLTKKQIDDYYNGFSNSSLWPILHYMTTYTHYEDKWFEAYKTVNQLFAETILSFAHENDLLWIHDYHLMLLPALLKQRNPKLKIGFFLHTPFPSYEVFRCHPDREELLKGVLAADLVGFHTFGYLRHFRSAVLRLLSIESEINQIKYENHITHIGVFPIGIDAHKFEQEMNSRSYRKCRSDYNKIYEGKKLILCVERLDYTKGIPRRLDAIELFLSRYDEKDHIVFVFICVPSRGEVPEYQDLIELVERRVGEINGKYSTIKNVPIQFLHKSVPFSQLCALYTLADAALVTPLIDGMNLVAKEYIACQREKNGVLILSEFAGAAHELFNALVVNPYDIKQICDSIYQALTLTENYKKELIQPMKSRVMKFDSVHWSRSFINELSCLDISTDEIIPTRDVNIGTIKPFVKACNIALFLDYDGTLTEIVKNPADAYPHDDLRVLFSRLEKQETIDTYIISGRNCADMDQWFSTYSFTLIAEHGYYFKYAGQTSWSLVDTKADLSWKPAIIRIFELFTASTPGSVIEEKTSSVVWHYRRSDPEFGDWKANELVGELYEMASNLPVAIHRGKKIVEVCSTQINKGMAVEYFLHKHDYDAVLCAGDDETDENMFRLDHKQLVSIKIGNEDTLAQYKVSSPRLFRDYLKRALERNWFMEATTNE
ncbi:MAG: bifunctional alpha,alpha-trehalose-phosphate synthase (UDP-forming)/trehalose-phosphatase, partial [Sedimentisphaerales bacterium]|nr:bifunctional alpha,alpha-trehalose-phosphate synthase (UDP-forming)/trehalose-phosphatase [Sedimentisphaerales bacterium]